MKAVQNTVINNGGTPMTTYKPTDEEYKTLPREQFKNLERNTDGDVIKIANVFFRLTTGMQSALTNDDQSRFFELNEEMEYMLETI